MNEETKYTYNKILFSLKKEEILTHATTWMNSEDIMLREIIQSQKRQGVDTNPEMTESLKLPDKNFKATIIKMFKQLQAITETQETNEII